MLEIVDMDQINKLEFLKNKHLGTNQFREIEINSINNFVRIPSERVLNYFFTGTFLFRQSASYLSRLIRRGVCYLMQNLSSDDNCDNELRQRIANNETKILAFELRSMHKGGRKKFSKKEMSKLLEKSRDIKSLKKIYKVFIEYYPLADPEKEYLNYYSLIESKFFNYPFNKQSKN